MVGMATTHSLSSSDLCSAPSRLAFCSLFLFSYAATGAARHARTGFSHLQTMRSAAGGETADTNCKTVDCWEVSPLPRLRLLPTWPSIPPLGTHMTILLCQFHRRRGGRRRIAG